MGSISYLHASRNKKSLLEIEASSFWFYNLYPVQCTECAVPAYIISNFVFHTVAEALRGTTFNSTFHSVLDFKLCQNVEKLELQISSNLKSFY